MIFGSIPFWAFVYSAASASRSCEDCVEVSKCPQAYEQVNNNYNYDLVVKLKNAQCGSSRDLKICCSEFNDDESEKTENTDAIENHQNLHLLSDDCGTNIQNRITGGEKAELYEFPWLVLLSSIVKGYIRFHCGGTLINPRYVLTAAHCLKGYKIAKVRVGEHDISKKRACFGLGQSRQCEIEVQDIPVQKVIIHPKYSHKKFSIPVNDIGLLRLKRPVDITTLNAGLICLPVVRKLRDRHLPGNVGTVAGWGRTGKNGDRLSDIVLKADVPIVSPETCSYLILRNKYDGAKEKQFENVFCADEMGRGTCKGDSGGPLMVEEEEGARYVQYGVVSSGFGCGDGIPSVYTDVTKYVKWILDNIKP